MDNCIKSGRKAALALKIQNSDQEACFAINFQPRTNEVSQNSPNLFIILPGFQTYHNRKYAVCDSGCKIIFLISILHSANLGALLYEKFS